MKKNSKIYIAGHRGLVGSAIVRHLESNGFYNFIFRTHKELDLVNQAAVNNFFATEKPDYVFLAAAKVGGIFANNTYPAEFIYENLMVEANVVNAAYQNNVQRLLFLGSSCIYPRAVKQPMREDALLTDVLEPTNEPYALAKIAGIKLCESYNRQYDTDYRSVMPTNLYGTGDNFHIENSHVIPAVMRKIHLAKCLEENNWQAIKDDIKRNPIKNINDNSTKEDILNILTLLGVNLTFNIQRSKPHASVSIWGSGKPMREFLHVDDMASACIHIMNLDKETYQANTQEMLSHINVGTGEDCTIRQMAKTVKKVVGFKGELNFDTKKPDGSPRKLMDVSRINDMGWKATISLEEGLESTYKWYRDND